MAIIICIDHVFICPKHERARKHIFILHSSLTTLTTHIIGSRDDRFACLTDCCAFFDNQIKYLIITRITLHASQFEDVKAKQS